MNEDNFDIGLTIQSQYSASPHIVALVNGFWSCLDPSADIELIFNKMINPITAEGFGLDVWGRIVAIGREYTSKDTTLPYWGYKAPLGIDNPRMRNFNNAPFYKEITGKVKLNDQAYRTYIFLKAMINIGNGSLSSLNRMISVLFPSVNIALLHVDTMVLRIVIQSELAQSDLDALLNLPWLPAGVGLEVYQVITPTWGLEGSGLETLDNGTFATNDIIPIN